MPKEFTRAQRVAEVIHHALAELILKEIPAKEFGMITVSKVVLSSSLDYAKIYITILNDNEKNIHDALVLLQENNKYLRHFLAKKLDLRIVPQLKFHYDVSIERARKLTSLIDEARKSDEKLKASE